MCGGGGSDPAPPAPAPPPPEAPAIAPEIDATKSNERLLVSSNRVGRSSLRIEPLPSSGIGLGIPT